MGTLLEWNYFDPFLGYKINGIKVFLLMAYFQSLQV